MKKNCIQNCPCQLLLSRGVYYEGKLGRLRRVFCSYVEWSTELTDINWFRYLFFFCSDSNNNSATPLLQFGRPLWPASTTALKFENHSIAMKTECSIHKKENIHYIHLWQSKTALSIHIPFEKVLHCRCTNFCIITFLRFETL